MPMRDTFHDDLDGIGTSLIEMGNLVSKAMERATNALLTADLKVAEEIISEDDVIDDMQQDAQAMGHSIEEQKKYLKSSNVV